MPPDASGLSHIRILTPPASDKFRAKTGGRRPLPPPDRDPKKHGKRLQEALKLALLGGGYSKSDQVNPPKARYVEVDLAPGSDDVIKSLEDDSSDVRLARVESASVDNDHLHATVLVPESAADRWLERKLSDYISRQTKTGKPRNAPLFARIEAIRAGTVRDVFTGDETKFPASGQAVWWEAWIQRNQEPAFRAAAGGAAVGLSQRSLTFGDVAVFLAKGSREALAKLMAASGAILELRLPSIPAVLETSPSNQRDIATDIADRVTLDLDAAALCLLDTGITAEHPLLAPATSDSDVHVYDPAWSGSDIGTTHGHGTAMAGLGLYGGLEGLLTGARIALRHRLESVKILPDQTENPKELYGAITRESVARIEVAHPERNRVFCLAVTAEESDGTPTSWSAEIDNLCFNDGINTRIILVSAGNIAPSFGYPDNNDLNRIQDPAQAWNAITVGAFTEKIAVGTDPTFSGWDPVAPSGALAPSSRTSVGWRGQRRKTPLKPEIVMEGGNWATDGTQVDSPDSLSLLTTNAKLSHAYLRAFGDTSAATALAARTACQIRARYPEYWPETIRGLLVHSSSWTAEMRNQFTGANQAALGVPLRRFGYGVPNPTRALLSQHNDVTLIIENVIQPFTPEGKSGDMHLHELPWPSDELLDIADQPVEIRVTLSYFIEPKPGERGGIPKYQYHSHRLRFELKRSWESLAKFRARINALEDAADEEKSLAAAAESWRYGKKSWGTGSVHSDIWEGSAGDLSKRTHIAVYPASGWWKEDPRARQNQSRYSLIVSLRAPTVQSTSLNLYSAIRSKIPVQTPISIAT